MCYTSNPGVVGLNLHSSGLLDETLKSGPGCSKLTMLLVNETLKFQTLISQISQYFLLKKCECKSFSHFFDKKIVYLVIKS